MQTALVTGAASGIGRATARRLADSEWRVYATDIDTEGVSELPSCETLSMDVTDADAVERVRNRLDTAVDGLDCLVVNAGFAQLGPLGDLSTAQVSDQFEVNVLGAHRTITAMLPLVAARAGTIVLLASTHGRVTTPGLGAYAASKHAVEAMAETLRMEVTGQDVDVVVVEPAWVETGFADVSGRTLDDVDRSEDYADIYDAMAEGTLIGGGPLAVSPDRVAATVESVAMADSPAFRYPVGLPAKLVLATRWLPDSVRQAGQRTAIRLFAALHRLRDRATLATLDSSE